MLRGVMGGIPEWNQQLGDDPLGDIVFVEP
jgi:hypothetical protein